MTMCMRIDALLVDDNVPFRDALRSMLAHDDTVRIVGEASDGFEAVRKAAELKPALVLLDIGLPGMNGIGVAKCILESDPNTIILFISMYSDSHFVRRALETGARGYVLKGSAGRDLWPAIQATMNGGRFVSHQIGFDVHVPA